MSVTENKPDINGPAISVDSNIIITEPEYIYHPDIVYSETDIVDKSKTFKLDDLIEEVHSVEIKSYFSNLRNPICGISLYTHSLEIGKRYEVVEPELDENGMPKYENGKLVVKKIHSYPDDNLYLPGDTKLSDPSFDGQYSPPIGKIYRNLGIIEFFTDLTPVSEGVDNIIVEYTPNTNYTLENYNFGTKFSIGNDERIMLYDNDTLYFSGYGNFSYIPYINTVKIGNSNSSIVGFAKLSDTTLAVFKGEGDENSIYYINATSVEIDGYNKVTFSVKGGVTGEIAVNNNTSYTLANDILFLSKNGVQSIILGENVTTNERYTFERSGLINSQLLKKNNLSQATAIVHKNRYYLAVDDEVFVADARFKSSAREEDMNDTFNYEWWHWDNMPVKKWIIMNDKLCFISKNNKFCQITDEFEDITIDFLSSGDWTDIASSDNYIQFNSTKKEILKPGNKLISNGKYYEITDVNQYNHSFRLKDENGSIVNTQGEFYANFNKSFYICNSNNVVSEWNTPILDMGTSIYSKNLLSSTLTFEPNVEGNVKFGYTTRRSAEPKYKNSNLSVSNGLDFEDLDFTNFSFNVNFACSRTLKTRVRNYNYIQFRIISDDNKDFALNNFVVTYNYGGKNKGVR